MSASANGSAQLRKKQTALLTKRFLSAIWQLGGLARLLCRVGSTGAKRVGLGIHIQIPFPMGLCF